MCTIHFPVLIGRQTFFFPLSRNVNTPKHTVLHHDKLKRTMCTIRSSFMYLKVLEILLAIKKPIKRWPKEITFQMLKFQTKTIFEWANCQKIISKSLKNFSLFFYKQYQFSSFKYVSIGFMNFLKMNECKLDKKLF